MLSWARRAGLLLASVRNPDPVVFLEAKMLYRTVVEDVPAGDYTIPLGQARIARPGQDITLVGWGQQVAVLEAAVRASRAVPSHSQRSHKALWRTLDLLRTHHVHGTLAISAISRCRLHEPCRGLPR
jgi:hypothetical protein